MITQRRLQAVLSYDPIAGEFRWLQELSSRCKIGGLAGRVRKDGYRQIKIDGIMYRAGRLAFFYTYGRWPKPTVDHRNRVRDDDRLENLVEATYTEQMVSKPRRTGEPNVYLHAGRYVVRKVINGNRILIGRFKDKSDAVRARDEFIAT